MYSTKTVETLFGYFSVAGLSLNAMLLYILFLLKRNHRANIFLSLFIVSISMPLIVGLVFKISEKWGGFFFCLSVGITSIAGAFLFLYMSILSGDIEKAGFRELFHLIPFPVFSGIMIFLFYTGMAGFRQGRPSRAVTLCIVLSLIMPAVYSAFTFLKIHSYSSQVANWFSDTEKVSMNWLKKITVLSLFLFVIWSAGFILAFFNIIPRSSFFAVPHMLLIMAVTVITTYYVISQPEIFRANLEMHALFPPAPENADTREKYAKQSIDEEMQKAYCDKLIRCMETQKPFLDEDITIGHLAEILDIPVHHLSIVINSMLGKNFATFINEYRIKEARALLDSDKDANILSVAFMSGFSSKSSFNNIFKKMMGKTPSEYRSAAEA
ncbi:MAG: helix-turn-helix domain-containing protein [Spirochaetota bacterium]